MGGHDPREKRRGPQNFPEPLALSSGGGGLSSIKKRCSSPNHFYTQISSLQMNKSVVKASLRAKW